jgi:hypothetical protein
MMKTRVLPSPAARCYPGTEWRALDCVRYLDDIKKRWRRMARAA